MATSALDKLAKRAMAKPMTAERGIEIPLDKIMFDPNQPRKAFHTLDGRVAEKDEAYIAELAQTIKENGLIQAITVQDMGDGTYRVVVGECRTRAHLLLKLPTIRAVVRNDLTKRGKRLMFQLIENVSRADLTDDELALSIRELMEGSEDEDPMKQVQIAAGLGKSEGWVTRLVRFGDEDLQNRWVKSGIVDTAENLYRVSILPKPMQVDLIRRVSLPDGDSDRLEIPLTRVIIDKLALEAKIDKFGGQKVASALPSAGGQSPDGAHANLAKTAGNTAVDTNGVASNDSIGQALAAAAIEGRTEQERANKALANISGAEYKLPDSARAAILGTALAAASGSDADAVVREAVQPQVNCRVLVSNLIALLDIAKSNSELLAAIVGSQCEINLPGSVAQLIANELMGVIVERKDVPATVQAELGKLR